MGCTCSSDSVSFLEKNSEYCHITLKFEQETKESEIINKPSNFTNTQIPRLSSIKSTIPESQRSSSPITFKSHISRSLPPCIHSGDLMKYHPGISIQFIQRYCVLTETDFKYYKSIHSFTLNEKPLFILPVSCIDYVRHTSFISSEKEKKFSKYNNLYQFEIFIKDEDEMTKISRDTDKLPFDKGILEKSCVVQMEDSVQDGKLIRRPIRSETMVNGKKMDRNTWSMREVEWCTAEKRLLFSAKNQEDACRWVDEIDTLII